METIYFSIGVLTMVLVALAALAVYSTVMVSKLKKENNDFQRQLHDVYRVISEREEYLRTEMRLGEQELSNQIDQLNEHINQLTSSTDRRFDKLIDTYFLVKDAEKESKKLIKG
jgi:TolA-binding protein